MELKLSCPDELQHAHGLNRTFYGIETLLKHHGVLIVPFMELKQKRILLNGIWLRVLIVPFMELKPR